VSVGLHLLLHNFIGICDDFIELLDIVLDFGAFRFPEELRLIAVLLGLIVGRLQLGLHH
jgi:hypothetical protein